MLRIIVLFLSCTLPAHAVTLTQTVIGDVLFDLTPLAPADAGDYFNNSYARDLTQLSVDNIPNDVTWTIFARISSEIPGITVRVRRKGTGTGAINPSGGTSYKKLTTTYKKLFTGEGKRFDIPMRTQLKGIGVSDNNGIFETHVEYKVETD
ncbi:MAG: hypothetical protein CSB47_04480 [Proteobacteria bacterium]|nr:MAG: hypothetical protein CSB47_04480 [Pseudomonadota bacterium]